LFALLRGLLRYCETGIQSTQNIPFFQYSVFFLSCIVLIMATVCNE
jgi:hypothetical protein